MNDYETDWQDLPIPPWPGVDEDGTPEEDELENEFGEMADGLRQLSEKELEEVIDGGSPRGRRLNTSEWHNPLRKRREWEPPLEERLPFARTLHYRPRGWVLAGDLPRCGELWILRFHHSCNVSSGNPGPLRHLRPTILRALAEAHRRCRERDPGCPDAKVWVLDGGAAGPIIGWPEPTGVVSTMGVWVELLVHCQAR